jgi:hypothetical protein
VTRMWRMTSPKDELLLVIDDGGRAGA